MSARDPFDAFAREYDQWFDRHPKAYALELEALRTLLPAGGQGIEIGAGSGRFTVPLGIALGIEPSAAMRTLAHRRGARVVAGNAESLPLTDGCCDYALLVTTICFLATPEVALREVHRVLKPNGYVVLGLIDPASPLGKRYAAERAHSRFYRDARFHTVDDIERMLRATGFGDFDCVQALLPGDDTDAAAHGIRNGHGQGSFVVLRARRHAS